MGFNQQPHLALLFFQRKLRKQIGNPEGEEKPNKKYYDPRACIRSAEESTVKRTLGAEGGVKNGRVFLVVGLREQKHVWRYGKQMDLVVDVFFSLHASNICPCDIVHDLNICNVIYICIYPYTTYRYLQYRFLFWWQNENKYCHAKEWWRCFEQFSKIGPGRIWLEFIM